MKYDITIVGAGIIGLSIAFQLARRSNLKILVLEKGAAVGEGSTGASSAVCRTRYSIDDMLHLARDGIAAYQDWQTFTGLSNPRAQFHNDGVLWMPGADQGWADTEHARLQAHGIASAVLDDQEFKARFPGLSTCILSPDPLTGEEHRCRDGGRQLLELDGGYVDPVDAAQDLLDASRKRGVDVLFNTPVAEVDYQGGAVKGVTLADGRDIATPLVINAAGPWCRDLFNAAGLESGWNLVPTRIQVLYLDRPKEVTGHIPVTVDMAGGIYFRTQNRGQQLVVSSVLEEDEREAVENPDCYNLQPDDDFRNEKLHILHHRLPALPYRGKIRGYCGLYTVNRDDVHPILGATALPGFWVANGFSGHGFKLAPAIGSLVAQAITGDSLDFDTAVPASLFAIDRQPIAMASRSVLA